MQAPFIPETIVPVYGSGEDLKSAGLTSRRWRSLVRAALDRFGPDIQDPLSSEVCESIGLPGLGPSLQAVHAPASLEEAELARRRLAFDELLGMQLELARRRQARLQGRGIQHRARSQVARFVASMPFSLTLAQERVKEEILDDMAAPSPMRRLLHGEVGSGKTVVALCAAVAAVENDCQVALMVPTEVLAEQHFATLQNNPTFEEISSVLLLGGQGSSARRELLAAVQSGSARVVVGTHALFQSDVHFERLGLIIVDEQHRFGVAQRDALGMKGSDADVLVMTATPIPRSLALTLYGDLDISTLDELPSGRRPVRTVVRGSAQRPQVLEFVARELEQGRQAYFVYPMIDESGKFWSTPRLCQRCIRRLERGTAGGVRSQDPARAYAIGRKVGGDGRVQPRRMPGSRLYQCGGGWAGCTRGHDHGGRECRSLWPGAVAPAARSRRTGYGRRPGILHPDRRPSSPRRRCRAATSGTL